MTDHPSPPSTHHESVDHLQDVIGYVRVSTEGQAKSGKGLEKQLHAIRDFCRSNRYNLTKVYEDVGSAVGKNSLRNRPELREAVDEAHRNGIPLVVSDMSRLSRDLDVLDATVIELGVTIISIKDDGEVPVGIMRSRVGKAQEVAEKIATGTRSGLAHAAKTKKLGSPGDQTKAAKASGRVRSKNRIEILVRVVDHLERHPDLIHASSAAIANQLNQAGILTGWHKPWTAAAVRGKLRQIKEAFELRQEAAQQDDLEIQEMKKHPSFGIF